MNFQIAKWKLPFQVVGVISHPVLPFMFCGTTYGCVNVLDVRNLKTPKLINRRFLTREPNPGIYIKNKLFYGIRTKIFFTILNRFQQLLGLDLYRKGDTLSLRTQ